MTSTLLVLSGIAMVDWAARGLTEDLSPIGEADGLARSLNGTLLDLSDGTRCKLKASWRCSDIKAPALNGIWPGLAVTVDCITEFSYLTAGGTPFHSVVPGSSRTDGDFTFYRPRLAMRITAYSKSADEWNATTGWSLQAEEV